MDAARIESLGNLLMDEEEAYHFAMQLATACALPMTLKAAVELELLELIRRSGPNAQLFPEEIAALLRTAHPDAAAMVDRILRLLSSYAIVTCSAVKDDGGKVRRRYGLAPASKFLVGNEDGESVSRLVLPVNGKALTAGWHHLADSVLSGGIPFKRAFGMELFEYVGTDPTLNKLINAGQSNSSSITAKKILETYDGFEGIGVLVDVGGGVGSTLKMIVSKYPSVKGVNFDLPFVIAEASPIPGVEHVAGDMFESVPLGDAMILKWILHDWTDEDCIKVLKNCWKALPTKGKVVVIEGVLPESPKMTRQEQWLVNLDMFMLSVTSGGREKTEKEYESLAMAAGFSRFDNLGPVFGACIMEFTK